MRKFVSLFVIVFSLFSCDSISDQQIVVRKLSRNQSSCQFTRTVAFRGDFEKSFFKYILDKLSEEAYYLIPIEKWHFVYKNHLSSFVNKSDVYAQLPSNTQWLAYPEGQINFSISPVKIVFSNAIQREVVVKKRTTNAMKPDLKIIEFYFGNEEQAKEAMLKMKLVSRYTVEDTGLYSTNVFFQYKTAIYLCRTRAAAFSPKIFQKKINELTVSEKLAD